LVEIAINFKQIFLLHSIVYWILNDRCVYTKSTREIIMEKEQLAMIAVRKIIINTLASFDIVFDESFVANIEMEVMVKNPKNPNHFAYIIARNKAVSIIRKRVSAKRKIAKELLQKEIERKNNILLNNLKEEFINTESVVVSNVSRAAKTNAKRNINFLFLRVFEKLTTRKIKERFYSDLSEEIIQKGIERGRKLFLKECISDGLRKKVE
jgi:predicted RNA polymerase sigma factor